MKCDTAWVWFTSSQARRNRTQYIRRFNLFLLIFNLTGTLSFLQKDANTVFKLIKYLQESYWQITQAPYRWTQWPTLTFSGSVAMAVMAGFRIELDLTLISLWTYCQKNLFGKGDERSPLRGGSSGRTKGINFWGTTTINASGKKSLWSDLDGLGFKQKRWQN